MRCFIAITLPEAALDQLEALAARIPAGRISPRENMHLTLVFLDEIDHDQAEELHLALSEIHHPALDIDIKGLDLFSSPTPDLLFAAIDPSPALVHLQEKVSTAARNSGISLKRRRFRPHVTLARFNRAPTGPAAERLAEFLGVYSLEMTLSFHAERVSLIQSELGRGPSRYTELAAYDLISVI
ncbi:RNA 2',3'-cyclic phosphodiesterase [Tropicimonas sp. TH_r6]|uniref:RNA 2',3'-cyclic phosphodiesterase n=1 Tax=Tropicimonas sp. TH_r6 TaxID=3082085 RepID=UPI0029556790|nr:RNA 2',3'-cyclic phosphodiesterase [Tropicimonas sp. TH_r6]MDV7141063.1 RNA 2',3'-cyclic phosphodiesterase [Tropicimonas sp. TH_r6]